MATASKKKTVSPAKATVVPAKSIAIKAKAVKVQAKPVAGVTPAVAAPVSKRKAVTQGAALKTVRPVKKAVPAKKVVATAKSVSAELVVKEKHKKPKLVRDSFTMPEAEYAVLGEVKKACIAAGIEVKKSQLLRVGLQLLKKTPVSTLKTMIAGLQPLKAGRPKLN